MSRRIPLVVLGAVVLAFGGLAALAGLALAVVFGSGNVIASGPQPVTTPTRALVSPMAEFDGVSGAPSVLGQARIDVEATARGGERGVFVGVATAADADRYLAGADVDLATAVEFLPFRLTTRHQAGAVVVPAPRTQTFWVARAEADSGTARLSWPARDGDYRIVFMNADGSPAVDVDARFALVVPSALRISLILLAAGLGTALLGGIMLTLGLLSRSTGPRSSSDAPRPLSIGVWPASSGPQPPSVGASAVVPTPAQGSRTAPSTRSGVQ
jgi:hypothetical protein